MKRIFILFVCALIGVGLYAATPTAASILSTMRSAMLDKPAIEAQFTINGGQGQVQGSILMSGAAFTMTTPQLKVWYDGKTQWTYLASTSEVSITEPTAEELAASNPVAILTSYDSHYKSRRLSDNNGRKRVELTPLAKDTGIEKIVVITDAEGKWPQAITVTFDDNRQISLVIDHIAGISKPAAHTFKYDPKLQRASEVIDLR